MLSLEDALLTLELHFTEPEGLLARIERGLPVDEDQLQMINVALQILRATWTEQDLLPKQNVRLLWNVLPRLEKSLATHPERKEEIENVIFKLSEWLAFLFSTPVMSEENAIAVVSQHVIAPSFFTDLRFGTINEVLLEDLVLALDTLAEAWKKKEYVSKIASGAMINMQDMVTLVSGLYREPEMKRLRAIEQQLFECISRCLED